jgi:hypothetical protein
MRSRLRRRRLLDTYPPCEQLLLDIVAESKLFIDANKKCTPSEQSLHEGLVIKQDRFCQATLSNAQFVRSVIVDEKKIYIGIFFSKKISMHLYRL